MGAAMDLGKDGKDPNWMSSIELFSKEETHLYFKSNIQLAYIYSTKALSSLNQEKAEALFKLAEQEFKYATKYVRDIFESINFAKEISMHHLRHGQPNEAVQHLERIVYDNSNDEAWKRALRTEKGIYSNLAAAYFGIKRYEKCLEALQTAKRIDKNSDHVHIYHIRAYLKLNKVDEALQYLAEAEENFGKQQLLDDLREGIEKHLENEKAKKSAEELESSESSTDEPAKA